VRKGETYGVHEAYYDELGRVHSLSEDPIGPTGDTVEELAARLKLLLEGLQKEALDFDSVCGDGESKPSR